jgi:apolipoprotein N-acyltransferase
VYAALVVFPQSSVFRLLLPLAPLAAGALATPRLLRSSRVLILVGLTVLQFWWIHAMYGHGNTFYLIP